MVRIPDDRPPAVSTPASSRLPRPLWLCLGTAVLVFAAIALRVAAPMHQHRRAAEEISRLGGSAQFGDATRDWLWQAGLSTEASLALDAHAPELFARIERADFRETKLSDSALEAFRGLSNLRELILNDTPVTDASLVHLAELPDLNVLYARHTGITGRGFQKLVPLRHLETLFLDGAAVDDEGLVAIGRLPHLKVLWLTHTPVTDAGLAALSGTTTLQALYLDGTRVTDTGLVHLKGLTNLEKLWLASTLTTPAGIDDLKSALRRLSVYK